HFVMNDLALSAAEPVYASNGQLLGVLGTHVTLSRLNQYLNTIVTDYGGIVYVVENPAGDLVANSQGKANFRQSGAQQIQRIKVDEIDEPEIVRAYLAWKNQRKGDAVSRQWFVETIVYDRLGLNWLIIVAIPQEPYLAPLMQGIYYSLFLTLIVIILAIFLYVKSTNIVLGPIRNLIQTTERFTAGEFSERAAVFRDDEIGVLSRAFNKMADEICHLINSLESKIKERTNELEQMNQVAKQAQEEAQSASEAKGAFLANVSHELRTPLNAILGYSELLQGDSELSRKNREYLGTIHRSGAHMLTLINDVLDIAKIESKKMSLSIGAFNLVAQLDDVTQMLKIRADAKNLEFIVVGQGSLPHYVLGDATKLRVVLINLIGNAIKFTEQGGVRVNFSATPVQESNVVF
ncbi:HAMP domain-containing protein, partial [bacterium]|nr:HAMP domain-containing protein [bacterium]